MLRMRTGLVYYLAHVSWSIHSTTANAENNVSDLQTAVGSPAIGTDAGSDDTLLAGSRH